MRVPRNYFGILNPYSSSVRMRITLLNDKDSMKINRIVAVGSLINNLSDFTMYKS